MLVPGAGEPNFDTFVADPFEGRKVRREREVVQLLEKLQPDMIMMDPGKIGKVAGCAVLGLWGGCRGVGGLRVVLLRDKGLEVEVGFFILYY